MLTNSKIALSVALVLATASAAAAAAAKHAVHHQTATERQPYADTYLGAGSSRASDPVNSGNPCYFKIQSIGNKDSNGITVRNGYYSCVRRLPRA
jgi:hypothetical protein